MNNSKPIKLLEDLDFLEQKLPKLHINLFTKITKKDFKILCDQLREDISSIDAGAFCLRIRSILAQIGDSHTDITNWYSKINNKGIPVAFVCLDGVTYISRISERQDKYLGSKLISIGGIEYDELFSKISDLIPSDNVYHLYYHMLDNIDVLGVLDYFGVKRSYDNLNVEVELKNKIEAISIDLNSKESLYPVIENASLNSSQSYNLRTLDNSTIYFNYISCSDDSKYPMEKVAKLVNKLIGEKGYNKIIIDLRFNSGGNSNVLKPFLEVLDVHKSNLRIIGLIGNKTFSSSIFHALDIRYRLKGTLIGENTGGSSESFGEVKKLTLPNTKIEIQYSTRYIKRTNFVIPLQKSIAPDIKIVPGIKDVLKQNDIVLQHAIATNDYSKL